jgi:transcription factor SPN1
VQERQVKPKRRVKRREDDEPRRVQKKRKRKQPLTEEDLNDLPPEKGLSWN